MNETFFTWKRAMQSSRTTSARRPQSATTAPNELAGHPVDRHVGQQLRIRRVNSGLSQTELGNKIGLSYQQVQKYESGRNRISASMLHDIASELDVPIASFFDGLEQSDLDQNCQANAGIDEKIAFVATAEGRRFIEHLLRLPRPLRLRIFAIIKLLSEDSS